MLSLDVDTKAPSDILDSIRSLVGDAAKETPSGEFEFDEGKTVVSPMKGARMVLHGRMAHR
ncbi:hypothetical protein [Polyangium mundeleinium]|uniref:Uncharacterized protein n=1 Tax=Polyangium mundeleinium TaxID=2995306 RepID=A0ABT5EX81_9BACT|nr:hypothetical protein [Polyangium mundeleinium]MDC0746420.1 hypothetical protein [Polyangium mundeleinium]